MLALRESKHLGHSRSQDNLRPIHENALHSSLSSSESALDLSSSSDTPLSRVTSPVQVKIRSPSRPTFAKMRRRSTLEWASAGPSQRQKTLEDVSAARMADIFFSLHVSGIEGWYVLLSISHLNTFDNPSPDPIYVSEVVKRAMVYNTFRLALSPFSYSSLLLYSPLVSYSPHFLAEPQFQPRRP